MCLQYRRYPLIGFYYSLYEQIYRDMIIIGLQLISRGESGRNIQDQLVANLPPKEKQALVEAAA